MSKDKESTKFQPLVEERRGERGRPRLWRPALTVALVGALVLGTAVSISPLVAAPDRKEVDLRAEAAPDRIPLPDGEIRPNGPIEPGNEEHDFFPGFWDVASVDQARDVQRAFDQGHQPWRGDPALVAEIFAKDLAGWRIEVIGVSTAGSAEEGWTASVTFRPYIGEEEPLVPGPLHTLDLVGLEGAEHPAWFVAGLRSENIVVDTPEPGDEVSSPIRVTGRGVAYEASIFVAIRDDAGNVLLGSGYPEGYLMGGAYELAPFAGDLTFGSPHAPSGILVLQGDTGGKWVNEMTIVRLRFAGVEVSP
jgi:hypothetical protein